MKWVLRISILILLLAVAALVWLLLRPQDVAGWCCLQAASACGSVSSYQECAAKNGKLYHPEQPTCDTLCSLVPAE